MGLMYFIPILSSTIWASDFEMNGVFYNILEDAVGELEVTYKTSISDKSYSGDVIIPQNVNYNGITYKVTSIGAYAFYQCSEIATVSLPESITSILGRAFCGCTNLRSINVPNSVSFIGAYAFYGCSNLASIIIPQNVSRIYDSVFERCTSLSSIDIPDGVTKIGIRAFSMCSSLTEITIPGSVNEMEVWDACYAFNSCTSLKTITIEKGVSLLGNQTFYGCTNVETVICKNKEPISINQSFNDFAKKAILYVPKGCVPLYANSSEWKEFKEIVEMEEIPVESFSLSITASGNGTASYNGTTVRDKTSSFTVNEGSSATITFSPDNGYRIKSVEVNGSVVSLTNSQYTISSIGSNSTVSVEFEAIPTCSLVISASGNGAAVFEETSIRNETKTFVVPRGSSHSIHPQTDTGYELKTVKLYENGVFVRSGLPAYDYHIEDINANIRLEFEFSTSYTLSIKAIGNGYVSFNGSTIQNNTSSFTIKEGKSATISFFPDNGYRIKSVEVNGSTVSLTDSQYTISSISANTTVNVEFEAITHTLSITASGNGTASYNGSTVRDKTSSFTVNEGTSATISFSPDNGYRIKSVKVNNTTVTVSNNRYTVSSISSNTSVSVEFEAITHTLSITASGNGSASYNGTTVRDNTSSFTVNQGSSATITFTPDNGYRIKAVKVNNSTVSISNNQYTISSIDANTTVSVEFEMITYTLSITSSGYGLVSYNSTTMRNETSSFTVIEGSSATITISPDNGYQIKYVIVNNTNVTSYVSNNTYTISSISRDTDIEVEFEAIPVTTYTLSITASGNGSASYNNTTIRSKTTTFTVNEGTNASITFSPDNGYRIKSVKVNNSTVTVSNNRYTISNIKANTTVSVEFEAIPATTYTLSITSSGNGSASYNNTTVRSKTTTFTVNEGANATITFSPDNGYRIKSVKVNNSTVTVSNNRYTISNIKANTTVSVEFEAIPATTYTLSITASGNGSASYNNTTVRSKTTTFTVNEGANATITFSPDNGYRIKSVKLNSSDVTSYVSNNSYTISNINKNSSIEVEFAEELKSFASGGINYSVSSYDDKTIIVVGGNYGKVLEVPAEITYQDLKWKVVGIDNAALTDNTELAAIIWNPGAMFTLNVSNPNLLLYVTSANYAPSSITNVIVNNTANKIVLSDAVSGNDFYCPIDFTAKSISYTHNYLMTSGMGESRGWETIALPFDVQKISHSSKGEITPFVNWKSGDNKKPFWLKTYGSGGWIDASRIEANTPYIISMPNHSDYKTEFRLNGNITFSSANVTVKKSDNILTGSYNGKSFVPSYANVNNDGYYALNVNNDYVTYYGEYLEGSYFISGLRAVRPFEAYMTSSSSAVRSIAISEDMLTGIEDITVLIDETKDVRVYNLKGQLVIAETGQSLDEVKNRLPDGVYIVNGKKLIIK